MYMIALCGMSDWTTETPFCLVFICGVIASGRALCLNLFARNGSYLLHVLFLWPLQCKLAAHNDRDVPFLLAHTP